MAVRAFRTKDKLQLLPINAGGATLAVGNVTGGNLDEIIVGTQSGLPVVRVFSATGKLLNEWLAYDPNEFDGVAVTVVKVPGGQRDEIATVPLSGPPTIKVFRSNGDRVVLPGEIDPIEIIPDVPAGFVTGGTVAAADVDFDDGDEVLFVPDGDLTPVVSAFEINGQPTDDFSAMKLFPSAPAALATTDSFVRR